MQMLNDDNKDPYFIPSLDNIYVDGIKLILNTTSF